MAFILEQTGQPDSIVATPVGGSQTTFADITNVKFGYGRALIPYKTGCKRTAMRLAGNKLDRIVFTTTDVAKAIGFKVKGKTVTGVTATLDATIPADSGVTPIAKHLTFTLSVGAVKVFDGVGGRPGGTPNALTIEIAVAKHPSTGVEGAATLLWA